jgi:hypothetical protein
MPVNYYPNSLTNLVTEFVRQKGKATLTEAMAQFPDRTKKQLHDALSNAQYRRLLKVIFRGHCRGGRETVWAVEIDKPVLSRAKAKPQPVASVWELGTPAIDAWPPEFEGGRAFNLLGSWDDESASNDSRKAA